MIGLWFALLSNIGVLFLVALFLAPRVRTEPGTAPSSLLIFILTALGTFVVIISFTVKRKILERSVEKQDINLVQKSLIIACVMCETSALLGLFERFLTGDHEYYLLFLIAAIGTAFHFPRREHLVAATYKTSMNGSTF